MSSQARIWTEANLTLDQCVRRGQKTPVTDHTLAIQWIGNRQRQKLAFEQHSLGPSLLFLPPSGIAASVAPVMACSRG